MWSSVFLNINAVLDDQKNSFVLNHTKGDTPPYTNTTISPSVNSHPNIFIAIQLPPKSHTFSVIHGGQTLYFFLFAQPHSYFRKFKGHVKEERESKERKKDGLVLKTN